MGNYTKGMDNMSKKGSKSGSKTGFLSPRGSQNVRNLDILVKKHTFFSEKK